MVERVVKVTSLPPAAHIPHWQPQRRGASLLELLVVVAILAVLIGLLLGAVQQARRSAQRVKSLNNLRQIVLATHGWATAHGDRFPGFVDPPDVTGGPGLWDVIIPYVEQGALYRDVTRNDNPFRVHLFVNPEDPTVDLSNLRGAEASYAANFQLFADRPRFTTVTDGLSNTIAFAEHYSTCSGIRFAWTFTDMVPMGYHRAAFAECYKGPRLVYFPDTFPETEGSPPVSRGSVRGLTFQAAPKVSECYPSLAQSSNPAGMEVALADGSVRMVRAGVDETVYWALVTPAAGEVVSDY